MQKKVYFCGMILNYIWISLILLAILMGLVQAILSCRYGWAS